MLSTGKAAKEVQNTIVLALVTLVFSILCQCCSTLKKVWKVSEILNQLDMQET